jgi:hypothetical protein
MRLEVLTAVKMSMVVFWVVTQCGLVGDTDVSEKCTTSIFRVYDARCHNAEDHHDTLF